MSGNQRTYYNDSDVLIESSYGRMGRVTKISLELPDVIERVHGVDIPKIVQPTASITFPHETLEFFTKFALVAGSWNRMAPIPLITYQIQPEGKTPFTVMLLQSRLVLKLPEHDRLEPKAVEITCPLLPSQVRVNGINIMEDYDTDGI